MVLVKTPDPGKKALKQLYFCFFSTFTGAIESALTSVRHWLPSISDINQVRFPRHPAAV